MVILSYIVYIPLQIVFIPFAILGALLVAYKQMVVSKRLGISQTAIEIINGRWAMHVFGMRDDEATAKLVAVLPNNSLRGLWLALFPLWVKYKIAGKPSIYPRIVKPGSETLADLVVARTFYFDRVIRRAIPQIEQFVLMGAGYDTRAYGNFQHGDVKFFELDQANVQQHKLAVLESAGISCEHVIFVSIDFSKERTFEKLIESGYDPSKKTLFLWEGVTLYLSEADVRKTMQDVRNNAPNGSILIADVYADRFLKMVEKGAGKKTMDYTNEGLDFSLDFSKEWEDVLSKFVSSESMAVGEKFFMGRTSEKGPFMVVVEMLCEGKN